MKLTVTYFLTDGEKICVEGDKTTTSKQICNKVQNYHTTPAKNEEVNESAIKKSCLIRTHPLLDFPPGKFLFSQDDNCREVQSRYTYYYKIIDA